jgi:kynurenine formamidase
MTAVHSRKIMKELLRAGIALALLGSCNSYPPLNEDRVVDLSHGFGEQTITWPTSKRFRLTPASYGRDEFGRWYASNDFESSEHSGTHLDAPIHFAENRLTTAEIPLEQLIGPAHVIDIRDQCEQDPDYLLAAGDIVAFERRYGPILPGGVVLVRTGFGERYSDPKAYLGTDQRGQAAGLVFPGISPGAAHLLVERDVDLVGIDTASLDHGPSVDFPTHRVLAEANIPGLENLANLDKLPPVGATIVAMPMKIESGTGGPCRIIAFLR